MTNFPDIEIKLAEVKKTFNTLGEVRYVVVFVTTHNGMRWDSVCREYKTEKLAQRTLEKLKAQYQK